MLFQHLHYLSSMWGADWVLCSQLPCPLLLRVADGSENSDSVPMTIEEWISKRKVNKTKTIKQRIKTYALSLGRDNPQIFTCKLWIQALSSQSVDYNYSAGICNIIWVHGMLIKHWPIGKYFKMEERTFLSTIVCSR